jgi:hypothetical protein
MAFPNQEVPKSSDFYFFTWRSILSTDEILEVGRTREQREREIMREWETRRGLDRQ